MPQLQPERFVRDGRANAALAWVVVGSLAVTALDSLASFRLVAAAMALLFAGVAAVPTFVEGDWARTYPWGLLAISASPAFVRAYGSGVAVTFAVFVGVATLALVAVLDVHLLTDVRLSTAFTTFFVVVATMGLTGFWAVFQWTLDSSFDSGFLDTNEQLMWGFVTATVAGVLSALVFERYLLGATVESEEAVE
ncbi:hypothetical protein [Halorussus salinisoli]|uniref:hypothetical protein n=1 Tax=Halorussus salinisoli TaxID=2558242 RepID=UPI0010C1E4C3|nr:hypothetical protein [Halorussus salinisoli]